MLVRESIHNVFKSKDKVKVIENTAFKNRPELF